MRLRKRADARLSDLRAAVWSAGEAGFFTRAGFVWQADATKAGHLILAWAET